MSVVYGLENVAATKNERVVAIGVFDGVHWGHRAIFERLREVAQERNLTSAALTFKKHPAELLAPDKAPLYINTLDQRIELIKSLNVDEVIVAEFSQELATLPRDEFIKRILVDTLQARHVVVGANFRFAKDREGDIRYLKEELPRLGIGFSVVSAVVISGGPVSSTRIRKLIGRGEVAEAATLLGRHFALRGTVVAGEQIGRSIGFPTANISVEDRQLVPARGVYAVESTINGKMHVGVCNIGNRPTFGGISQTIEVHFIGFDDDIYGETLDIEFCRRIRDEMAFDSPEKLVEQIKKDVEMASG